MACYQCCIVDDTLMSIYLTATCGNRALLYLLTLPSLKDKGNIIIRYYCNSEQTGRE